MHLKPVYETPFRGQEFQPRWNTCWMIGTVWRHPVLKVSKAGSEYVACEMQLRTSKGGSRRRQTKATLLIVGELARQFVEDVYTHCRVAVTAQVITDPCFRGFAKICRTTSFFVMGYKVIGVWEEEKENEKANENSLQPAGDDAASREGAPDSGMPGLPDDSNAPGQEPTE